MSDTNNKTAKLVVSKEVLQRIIAEELRSLHEQVDHEGAKRVVNAASKLLKAIEAFKDDPTPTMVDATTPHLDVLYSTLEDMVSNPGSYVVQVKSPTPKKRIKLRKVDS